MKLKTRIAVITTGVLVLCCVLLYLWNAASTNTMMDNIRLLEPSPTTTSEARYARLQALDQQESNNQTRLLLGLASVVILGGTISYFAANLAMKPVRDLTKTIQQFRTTDLKTELPLPKTKDESYDLILAFNDMIHRLNGSFDREKRISANIAHEFRTPLTVLLTKYEVLEMKHSESVEDYKKVVSVSKEKVEYLSKITSDLLALYRQIHQVNNNRFDLSELLQEIEDNYLILAREKNITLVCESPSVFVFADRLLFGQMLSNFIENAIKYNTPGGKVTVCAQTAEKELTISVQDTGIGIPDDKKPFLFEPFYRIEQSRNKLYGGTGLGLAFAKEIIQLYRGDVCIKDIEPTGSIFILTFPDMTI